MTAKEFLDSLTINQGFWVLVVLSLIQIAPIKLNPWSCLFKWIGKAINGETIEKLDALENKVTAVERKFEIKNANDKRWDILDFFNSSRNGRPHAKEEWDHAIAQVQEYRTHVKKYKIDNGVLEEASKWIEKEYQEHIDRNDFLTVEKEGEL